jgi:hypothetical protein
LDLAAARIRESGHPNAEESAERLFNPPSKEEMLELFGKREIGSP